MTPMSSSIVCETKIEITPFSFEWRFDHPSAHLTNKNDRIDSLEFEAADHQWCLWAIREPNGIEDWLNLYFCLNKDQPKIFSYSKSSYSGFKFIRFSDILNASNGYLDAVTGLLTIRVEGRIFGKAENKLIFYGEKQSDNGQLRVLDGSYPDFGSKLLDSSKFSDFTIKAGNDFKVHKNILAARSDYFAALFESGMQETLLNEIVVEDIGREAIEQLIRFIYTGKVKKCEGFELELLQAADKYQLAGLKKIGEQALYSSLSFENACEMLVHADRHSATLLKNKASEFITRNHGEVMKTKSFCKFSAEHPHLVAELFASLAASKTI